MSKIQKRCLILILIIAAVLRVGWLSRGDTVNDEVFMSFRGLGLMDFDEASAQTTPWEWQDPHIQWWAKISLHDHPLLVPLVQKISMAILGESNFGFRLPSALLGVASVYLVFLLGRILFSVNAGLFSAALLAVTLNSVYISRVGMQEAYVIFFLLLASYLFLKSLKEEKYLIWTGAATGLAGLAKYNSLILIPIFFTYLLFFKREYFFHKKLWLGALAGTLIFSPVIIYNLMLYRSVGHFDFQFAYIFGQHPEVWKVEPGKEIGGLMARINNFLPRLIATNSWLFLLISVASILSFLGIAALTFFRSAGRGPIYLLFVICYLLFLLLLIGPSYRFLTMLTPFLALGIGAFFDSFVMRVISPKFALFALALILAFEIFYSWNNQIAYYPVGPSPWLASKVRYENYNWGYNQLGDYLEKELQGKMPALTFDLKYKFLDDLRDRAIKDGLAGGLEPYPALFVYDGNFDKAAKLWVLDRLHIYHAWPIISLQTYYDYLKENELDYYQKIGFKNYYFILETNIVPAAADYSLMRGELTGIKNLKGETSFQIYKWSY